VKDGANWKPPGPMSEEEFAHFLNVGMDVTDPNDFAYVATYADYWLDGLAPNQPIRMHGDTLQPELGYTTFAAAHAGWDAVR